MGTQTVITEFPEYDEKFRADEKFAKFLKGSGTPKELSQPFLGIHATSALSHTTLVFKAFSIQRVHSEK